MEAYSYDSKPKEEIIGGEIHFMSPTANPKHARISGNLYHNFRLFFGKKKCQAYGENLTIIFDEANKVVPDLVIVCDPKKMTHQGYKGVPSLIAEIISPGSVRHDRKLKFELYERFGVPEYWIVEPNSKLIEKYVLIDSKYDMVESYALPDGSEDEDKLPLQIINSEQFPELVIDLNDIFEDSFEVKD
jgi:Uncharacterized protein conserved in cyanobacteria